MGTREEIADHAPLVGASFAKNHNNGLLLQGTPHFTLILCIEHIQVIKQLDV
jgi:hypothetical protein